MFFVVRAAHPGRDAKILLQLTTNTYNAYNSWGGTDLYRSPNGQGRRVSFNRPSTALVGVDGLFLFNIGVEFQDELDKGTISAALQAEFSKHGISLSQYKTITIEQSGKRWVIIDEGGAYTVNKEYNVLNVYDAFSAKYSGWRNWEQPFVEWAERAGYKMEYAVNSDLEFHPENLKHYRLVLSVGHDEYWSSPMRDHLEAFIAGGGNVAFFSGNSVCWQVRSEDNGRSLVGWEGGLQTGSLLRKW